MNFKIGQVIKFYKAQDDSGTASECFGFDASCGSDWLAVQYYPEQVLGEVVKTKGTILVQEFFLKADGERYLCGLHDLSKNGIEERISTVKEFLNYYNLSEEEFFEGEEVAGFELFYRFELQDQESTGDVA